MQGKETQQGYVLAFSLILLAFASIILISALERTGIEKRIATSELHRATLEAAAEAGIHDFMIAVREFSVRNKYTDGDAYCTELKKGIGDFDTDELTVFFNEYLPSGMQETRMGLGSKDEPVVFMEEPRIFWYLSKPNCEEEGVFSMLIHAEQNERHIVSSLNIKVSIDFAREYSASFPPELEEALGRFADYTLAAGGAGFTANGQREYHGKVGSGGPLILNGSSLVNGSTNHEEQIEQISDWVTMPHPGSSTSHTHFTGFTDSIRVYAAQGKRGVIEQCHSSDIPPGTRYIYCPGNFGGDIHDGLNNLVIVATGNVNVPKIVNEGVSLSIVTNGNVTLDVEPARSLSGGVIWAAGTVTLNGGPQFETGIVALGSITINGGGFNNPRPDPRFVPVLHIDFEY
ncbi:hypothetical protein V6U78_00525 [Marinospirillum sp. MEB164]|uniref:PilX N-terminal n=1 Tax=Marinospirillum alkalitolerans TaxID=3123374 RepID=A0ABW8PTG3_9GAMM